MLTLADAASPAGAASAGDDGRDRERCRVYHETYPAATLPIKFNSARRKIDLRWYAFYAGWREGMSFTGDVAGHRPGTHQFDFCGPQIFVVQRRHFAH